MSSNTRDSGTGSEYQTVAGDDTRPSEQRSSSTYLGDYLIKKFDQNIDAIKEDVSEIKHQITVDQRMIISDISIGIVSSLIVSLIFLFVTTNIGVTEINIFGMKVSIFILFVVTMALVAFSSSSITKKYITRNPKKYNKKSKK